MKQGAILDKITNGVAVGGMTMPVWEQQLIHAGNMAQALVPILSALWLLVQIGGYVRKRFAK